MKDIERGTIKYLVIVIVAVSLCGMILYPLFDLILCKLITKSEFTYSILNHKSNQFYLDVFLEQHFG